MQKLLFEYLQFYLFRRIPRDTEEGAEKLGEGLGLEEHAGLLTVGDNMNMVAKDVDTGLELEFLVEARGD